MNRRQIDLALRKQKLQMRADAQRDDGTTGLAFQRRDRGVIQMVPVIVRDQQNVDFRNVVGGVKVGAVECLRRK